jgi:hypothetical protein
MPHENTMEVLQNRFAFQYEELKSACSYLAESPELFEMKKSKQAKNFAFVINKTFLDGNF